MIMSKIRMWMTLLLMTAVLLFGCIDPRLAVPPGVDPDGLLAFFPLDGNALDSSACGKHGTVSGAVPASNMYGNANKALFFDGVDDYITIPAVWDNPDEFTVSFWFKPEPFGEATCFYLLGIGDGGWLTLFMTKSYYAAEVLTGPGPAPLSRLVSCFNDGSTEWRHAAVVWSRGDFLKLYMNGVLVDTETLDVAEELFNNHNTGYICSDNCHNYPFKGCVDELKVFDRALSDGEIAALAQQ